MAEQVALLLADVYGMSDQESAGRLQMPLSGFGSLLDCARNRMIRYAGGRCALVGNSSANAPAGTGDADQLGAAPLPDSAGRPAKQIQWKVDEDRLPALRRELMKGLGP
jgi:hypothetical protein